MAIAMMMILHRSDMEGRVTTPPEDRCKMKDQLKCLLLILQCADGSALPLFELVCMLYFHQQSNLETEERTASQTPSKRRCS
jgi:hypothetical protein